MLLICPWFSKSFGSQVPVREWREPTRPGVGSLSRKRYTQYVEQNRTGHCGNKSENQKETYNGGGAVCYGAEKH
jgi:hypothetical protein